MLHAPRPEPPHDGHTLRDVILPRSYPRVIDDQPAINAGLKRFELAHEREIRAGLTRRLSAIEEMLATLTHNLERVQVLDQQVSADRARMLDLLAKLEQENAALRQQQGGDHARGKA